MHKPPQRLKTKICIVALSYIISFCAGAASVPNTFVAGTPATASEVNADFQALVDSVTAAEVLISNLQSQIDDLKAQNAGFNGGDLTGSIYCFANYGSELTGGAFPGVYTSHSKGVLTFTSTTQIAFADGSDVDAFLNTSTSVIDTGSTSGGPSETFSYTLSGSTLTIIGSRDDGSNNIYQLSLDGNVLIGDNSSLNGSGNHEADLSIAVRASSCL